MKIRKLRLKGNTTEISRVRSDLGEKKRLGTYSRASFPVLVRPSQVPPAWTSIPDKTKPSRSRRCLDLSPCFCCGCQRALMLVDRPFCDPVPRMNGNGQTPWAERETRHDYCTIFCNDMSTDSDHTMQFRIWSFVHMSYVEPRDQNEYSASITRDRRAYRA